MRPRHKAAENVEAACTVAMRDDACFNEAAA